MNVLPMIAAALTLVAGAAHADHHTGAMISKPDISQSQWQTVEGTAGAVSYNNVEGELFGKGPYAAFVKFAKGTDNGLHTHSQALPTVVLEGTFYAVIDGKRVEYPAGSYYQLPANLAHESGCTAATDCLLFQYQADAFDLVPVKG